MTRRSHNRRHDRFRDARRSGFTLLELMVALVAGLLVITSIYFVSAASTRHFHEQQRIAQTQMNVRMAMEQLRRDVQRAGYLGTPNSEKEVVCVTPPQPVQAVAFDDDEDTGMLPNASQNGVTADRLTLTGNFNTDGSYLAIGLSGAGNTIYLQRNWEAFRRDFGIFGRSTAPHAFDEDAFEDAFRTGDHLHIVNQRRKHFFVEITSVNPTDASISFNPSIGIGGHCVGGLADGAMVAPLSTVEYRVDDITDTAEVGEHLRPVGGRVTTSDTDYRGQFATQLIRRELDASGSQRPASERIVLEYVANIDYAFVVDTQTTSGQPPQMDTVRGGEAETVLTNAPHRVRSVIASLSARTAEQDPRFPWVASAAGDPTTGLAPTRYRVHTSADYEGAARVRTLQQEIVLHNVANRTLR